MDWQQVHLFISSTFRDMYYEREYLIKNVMLELKSWCLERRLILSEIDLRWGVTEYMAKEQRLTIYKCLRGVDASRPFFLCLLGQYRGWKPELSDMPSPTIESYPALAAMAGKKLRHRDGDSACPRRAMTSSRRATRCSSAAR